MSSSLAWEEDIHERPTLPNAIPIPGAAYAAPPRPKIRPIATPAQFFQCADVWEERTAPRLELDLGEDEHERWWVAERRRWLTRWVAVAVVSCLVLIAVALAGQLS